MNVRPATAADIPAMLDLERQCPAAAHWSPQHYDDLFCTREDGARRFVLVLDESAEGSERGPESQLESSSSRAVLRTLGFLIAHHVHSEWELENLVVAPAFRRRGLATRLLTALLLHAAKQTVSQCFSRCASRIRRRGRSISGRGLRKAVGAGSTTRIRRKTRSSTAWS